jgi:hypothetical protein
LPFSSKLQEFLAIAQRMRKLETETLKLEAEYRNLDVGASEPKEDDLATMLTAIGATELDLPRDAQRLCELGALLAPKVEDLTERLSALTRSLLTARKSVRDRCCLLLWGF